MRKHWNSVVQMHRRFLPYEDEAPGIFIIMTPFDNAAQTCYMAGGPLHLFTTTDTAPSQASTSKQKTKKGGGGGGHLTADVCNT